MRLKNVIKLLGIVAVTASVLGLTGSFVYEANAKSKAMMAQRVEPDDFSALVGEPGRKVGSPQVYIIEDKSLLLPGKTKEGAVYLNETALKEKGIYPVQLFTVEAVLKMVRIGFGVALLVGLAGLWFGRKAT